MSTNVTTLPKKGRTLLSGAGRTLSTTNAYGADSVGVEGYVMDFDDVDPAPTSGVQTKRSNRRKTCILVRNVSGITLAAKNAVTWKSGQRGKRVDGYARVTDTEIAGIVDEAIGSNGVPDHDLFWLEVRGPCLCKSPYNGTALNVITAGQALVAVTAAASTAASTAGKLAALVATSNATDSLSQALNYVGYAMSSLTTGNTAADLLVDLKVLK